MSDKEKIVRDFYDNFGWVEIEGVSGEDSLFRDFSRPYYPYHDGVNIRTMTCFSNLSGKLLMAGGGDFPETHVTIAQKFLAPTCLDISHKAIEIAKRKLKHKGEYIIGSILSIPKSKNILTQLTAHPLNWWTQFDNECDLELIPWDVMGNTQEKQILMNDAIAWLVYRFCSWFENKYPKKAVQWWSYPVIVLTKKSCK